MTTPLRSVVPAVGRPALAGFEFSPGELLAIIAVIALIGLAALIYLAFFMTALIRSTEELHRAGRIRRPYLLALAPVSTLVLAFELRATAFWPLIMSIGLAAGYALMFSAKCSWFRWTVIPLVPFLAAAAVGYR